MSEEREILGYSSGNTNKPIYKAKRGQIVTQAFIFCSQCFYPVSTNMGPMQNAWCITCTENKGSE